jgi:hypothetical protein
VCSSDLIVQRGSIIAALVWALERAEVRVSIEYRSLVSTGGYGYGTDVHVFATIKPWGQRLNLRGSMFWLAHPAASRRAIFAQVYRVAREASDVGWSRQSPRNMGSNCRPLPLPKNAVDVPALHTRDLPTVEEWMHEVCVAAGVAFGKGRA